MTTKAQLEEDLRFAIERYEKAESALAEASDGVGSDELKEAKDSNTVAKAVIAGLRSELAEASDKAKAMEVRRAAQLDVLCSRGGLDKATVQMLRNALR